MHRAKIEIKPPFDMRLSLKFATACRFESEEDCLRGRFRRLVEIDSIPVLLIIDRDDNADDPTVSVRWQVPENRKVERKDVLNLARHIVSADLDLYPFYQKISRIKKTAPLIDKYRGLKPILTPSVYESAAWAIMGQQVNLSFAAALKKRLADKYGRFVECDGYAGRPFPGPETIAGARISQLRAMQFSNRKAEYLIDLSKAVAARRIKLEELSDTMPEVDKHLHNGLWSGLAEAKLLELYKQ